MFSNRVELSKGGKVRYYGTSNQRGCECYKRAMDKHSDTQEDGEKPHMRFNRREVIGLNRLARIFVRRDALLYTMCISCAPGPVGLGDATERLLTD